VSGAGIVLAPGVRLLYDGEVVEVVELSGTQVTVRVARTNTLLGVGLARLVSACRGLDAEVASVTAGTALATLTPARREQIAVRAGHVREVLTGYRSGDPQRAGPGEPRAQFAGAGTVKDRVRAKAEELGISARTVHRWVADYRAGGEAALVDARTTRLRGAEVDPRWDDAVRAVLAEKVRASTPTRTAVLELAAARLETEHGPGVVTAPSRATAYRRLAELTKGTNAVAGSAKARRSIADRPQGVYGRLRATRPGEYVVLDTQDLDVFAMEAVTCRWVRTQLTVAQDLFTRCIVGLRVTAVSTKAIDVAGVLHDVVVPRPVPAHWPAGACWPYHGLPGQVVFTEDQDRWAAPVCAPETLVVDHGKVFLSAHVMSVCARLGVSVQPALPHKPTDKPTVERFFKTLREGLIQHLLAYKGPDVYSRGERVEDEAFLFVHELEDVIREWVAACYHVSKHAGLVVPAWPHLALSPAEMFEIGVATAGMLRIPASPELAYDFLPVSARTIQHYGVEVNGLRYNGPALDGYRNTASPYGGVLAGKWPIRVNPDDVRYAWFQDPDDGSWHRLEWEHAAGLDAPFSGEAARWARRLAAADPDDGADPAQALRDLLARWKAGVVSERRERHAAVRLSQHYAALPDPDPQMQGEGGPEPGSRPGRRAAGPDLRVVPTTSATAEPVVGDDDEDEDTTDDLTGEDYYADAFEVIE
jgi:transposase InsO family protein